MSKSISPENKDTNGDTAPLDLIAKSFMHTRRRTTYEVIGYCWIGDTDEWGVLYSAPGVPVFCRSLRNFTGTLDDGEPRFVGVADV